MAKKKRQCSIVLPKAWQSEVRNDREVYLKQCAYSLAQYCAEHTPNECEKCIFKVQNEPCIFTTNVPEEWSISLNKIFEDT